MFLLHAEYGMQALMSRTFVDEVFGGLLVSTVKCDVCGNVSSLVHFVMLCMYANPYCVWFTVKPPIKDTLKEDKPKQRTTRKYSCIHTL